MQIFYSPPSLQLSALLQDWTRNEDSTKPTTGVAISKGHGHEGSGASITTKVEDITIVLNMAALYPNRQGQAIDTTAFEDPPHTTSLWTIRDKLRTPEEDFELYGYLIHYSSTKSKRVTRSVIASEIYGVVSEVDMAIAIRTTAKMITDQLNLPKITIIVWTDSRSIYECLVKLGATKEKR
ncbi:hypothetical protein B7494_g6392 [Chlorociboria aeruginascens]|nr:hypothetical protein B7494_g6392 [Chlorociboria aeruginascens]